MAEAWCRSLHPKIVSASAGTKAQGVNPYAVKVMQELDIDMSMHRSQVLEEFDLAQIDYVVTVCDNARETCPLVPAGCKHIHHSFDDPPALAAMESDEERALSHYQRVRDEIRDFVQQLPGLLATA